MPTVTTTVTSACASGTTSTVTTTEASPDPVPAPVHVAAGQNAEEAAASAIEYPKNTKEVNCKFLAGLLGDGTEDAPVCGFRVTPVAAQGFQAESYFCELFYFEGTDEAKYPKTIVLKTTASGEAQLGLATMMSSYLKEATVYNTLPALLPIAMPKVYGAFGTVETCMLVLEDLRELGSLVDQNVGGTLADATNMITDMGKLHGKFMTSTLESTGSLLDEPWLATDAGKAKFIYPGAPLQSMYKACWPGIQDAWLESPLKHEAINPERYPDAIELCKIFASEGNKNDEMWNVIYAHLQSRPVRCLCHGDPRGDNSFRRADDGSIIWIDWQMAHTGSPGYELAHQNQQTFTVESGIAAAHEAMLPTYYETMAANATDVPNFKEIYSYEDMLYDYKLGHILYGTLVLFAIWDIMRDGKAALLPERSMIALDDMSERISFGLQRTNCLEIAKEIEAKAAAASK